MPDTKSINVNWITDRFDDDVIYHLKDATTDLVSSAFSIFGYEILDQKLKNNMVI